MKSKRDYSYDNIKCILIFCVVLGHLLEIWGFFRGSAGLYKTIYSFHMPVFIFLNGYFARYSGKKKLCELLYPYLLFQTLYLLFDHCVLQGGTGGAVKIQFTRPYWILWYQLVLLFFYLLLPLLCRKHGRVGLIMVAVCFALSFLAGYCDSIGYFLSLSRFFTFLPYFALGCWVGHYRAQTEQWVRRPSGQRNAVCLLLCGGVAIAVAYVWNTPRIAAKVLYGAFSYRLGEFDAGIKLVLTLVALIWIFFFLVVGQRFLCRRISIVSTVGRYTLPIFLLHAFIIKLAELIEPLAGVFYRVPLLLLPAAVLLLILLGNAAVARAFHTVFTGHWLVNVGRKRERMTGGSLEEL